MQVNNRDCNVLEVIINGRTLKNVEHITQIIKPTTNDRVWEIKYPHVSMIATGNITVVIEREYDINTSDINELLRQTQIIEKPDKERKDKA